MTTASLELSPLEEYQNMMAYNEADQQELRKKTHVLNSMEMFGMSTEDLALEHAKMMKQVADRYSKETEKFKTKASNKNKLAGLQTLPLHTPPGLTTPTTARAKPPKKKKDRALDEIYEARADKALLAQKMSSDVKKHDHEKKTHENIILREHTAHKNKVEQLKMNEMEHINQVYLNALKIVKTYPNDAKGRLTQVVNDEKRTHEYEVYAKTHQLKQKFEQMEKIHGYTFAQIEKSNDKSRKTENNITKNYNNAKEKNYAKQFIFGVALENPQEVMDSALLTNEEMRFLKRQEHQHPLLQTYARR